MNKFDVYAYGVISSSTLHLLSQPFPKPDEYAEIKQTHFMTGGEALNSAIVLSRLGLRVQLDGNWIGDTPDGKRLLATIQKYFIDTQRLKVKKGFAGVQEIVFSDEQSRTIFGNYIDLLSTTRKWNIPKKTDLKNARIICIDPPFQSESELVGKYAVDLGKSFVSIDCPYDHILIYCCRCGYHIRGISETGISTGRNPRAFFKIPIQRTGTGCIYSRG